MTSGSTPRGPGDPPEPSPTAPGPASPPAARGPGSARFPKIRRIRVRPDYQRIQGRGQRLPAQSFLLMALRQPGKPGPARLGITVSRKSGESVQRSRIKRLVREAFRLHQDEFPAGWDFVVISREGADTLSLEAVVAQLRGALAKLNPGAGRRPPHGPGSPPRRPGPRKSGPPVKPAT